MIAMRPPVSPRVPTAPPTSVEAEIVYQNSSKKSVDTDEDVKPLLQAIEECRDMDELHLQGFSFGKLAAARLGASLAERGGKMKSANWSDIFVSRTKEEVPVALASLMSGLMKAGSMLTLLDLSNNAFGAQGVRSLVDYFESDLSCNLQELNLTNTGLGIGGAHVLSSALIQVKAKLKCIRIGRNRLENEGSIVIAEVLKNFTTLEILEMPQNGIYHRGIEALCEALAVNTNMKELILSDNTIGPFGSKALKKVLPKLKNLERLYLDDCLLKNQGARFIFEALEESNVPMLMELNLASNEISDQISETPIEYAMFWRSNIYVTLSDNRLSKAFREYLLSGMAESNQCEICFGEDDELEDEYDDDDDDEEEEDLKDDDDEEDDEDDDIDVHDISQHTSDEENEIDDDDEEAINMTIPIMVNNPETFISKKSDNVELFLNNTSKENFSKLGTKPVDSLLKHLGKIEDEEEYTDELVKMIFKLNIVEEDPKGLIENMKSWEEENKSRASILANAFLVHLGLIKSEDKKKTLCGTTEDCVKAFAKSLKTEDYSPELRDMILFVIKDRCAKEKKIGDLDCSVFLELLSSEK